jgi:hypothetical protein
LILDLRNNSGGLVSAGVSVANTLLDGEVIVETEDRGGIQSRQQAGPAGSTTVPILVMVNRGTASASEILGGALQDNGRAILVGGRTFGKGLIQTLIPLGDGSGLAVTVARYLTPAGHNIQGAGIEPDMLLDPPEPLNPGGPDDTWLEQAQQLLAAELDSGTADQAGMSSRTYHDPLHGAIRLDRDDPAEAMAIDLIDTAPFQRLRRIRQLGPAFLTFHGAESSRFTHSLGVLQLARQALRHLERLDPELARHRVVLYGAALLHDVGHGPLSHSGEDMYGLRHETWSGRLIRSHPELRDRLNGGQPGTAEAVANLLETGTLSGSFHRRPGEQPT